MRKTSNVTFLERVIFHSFLILEQLLGTRVFKPISPFKLKFLNRLLKRLSKLPPPIKINIDRIDNLSAADFKKNYFQKSTPVIFSGAAKNWACTKKWNLDYFKFGYGEKNILIVNASGLTSREENSNHEFLTVNELINNIKNGGDKYLRFSPLLENNPELVSDLDMDWLQDMKGEKTFANTYYMFLGGKSHKTLLHTDQPCNIYVQIFGEKKWTLFSAEDSALIYPTISNTAYIKSPVEVDSPDHTKFPLYKYAQAYEAHLSPGDVLYVPPNTWHFVENLTDSIAVGYRFSSLRAAIKASFSLSLLRILSTNPPIWKTMEYGKIDTNLIWAHSGGKIKEILKEYKVKTKEVINK